MQSVHQQLMEIGEPIVKFYVRDLTFHDLNACAKLQAGDTAFWMPRECGTQFVHLAPADGADAIRWNLGWLNASEKTFQGHVWYKIENGRVRPTTIEHARECFYRALAKFSERGREPTWIW